MSSFGRQPSEKGDESRDTMKSQPPVWNPRGVRHVTASLVMLLVWSCGTAPVVETATTASPIPSATASPSPAPTATPTPAPTTRLVTLKPAEVILPLGEFPIAGYKVLADQSRGGDPTFSWYRQFGPFSSGDYFWVSVEIFVYRSATAAHDSFVSQMTKCDYGRPESVPVSSVELTAPPSGELVHACLFHFANGGVYAYETLSRNVIIMSSDNPRLLTITDAAAVTMAADVAKKQIDILERVAPR